ncbi:MAG: aminoglycoside phosphotransferase family protein [Anaerolineae bacterium]|nr:aminoglycoside phosphotransferase family protein [Anaerolineae bacterium]
MKEISLDKPIARGRTAEVYDWDEGHVLKLFYDWFDFEAVEYEMKIARAVHISGVKSPAVRELIQYQGRNGLIYERVAGDSMIKAFQRKPWNVIQYGRLLAQLHTQMHDCVFNADVLAQRVRLQNKINRADALPASLKASLLNALLASRLPDGDRVCHGDFHPDNVLLSEDNATVIDWTDASRGNPIVDVARTSIILLGVAESAQTPNLFIKGFVKIFHSIYLKHYFRLRPGGEGEYRCWLPIVAGARLSENIPELEAWLIQQASKAREGF